MPDPKHERLRRIFGYAIELSRTARIDFLERECGGDVELKQRLVTMLAAAEDDAFLSSPKGPKPLAREANVESERAAAPLHEGPGTRIGPYKLLQQIGEGGFGSVFMAEQELPVRRRVALKIIKLGMDTRQVVARFEQERQALALMDHPNIARVIDAGATETGRPYFVMDLVKGDPIAEYCDKNNLSIDERLELFAQVCTAVQHAHTKGIIHRDIKPSNILVATQDGKPIAKVIDFGIAKATSAKLTDKTLFTEHDQVIGTLQYMSPEQAEGSLDIDTRTDVYSLGVVLYELLTGSTPFDAKTMREAFYSEVQRMIREVEPPKPSTRLRESTGTLASVAARRRVEPKRLGTIVRGELDWIVMKALEKDRARRYESASGLALDLQRYLSGDAVVAAPPSASYRLRKFVRRNKGTVTAVAAVAAALLVGLIAFAWQAKVAREQRDLALVAEKAEAEQRKTADVQRERAVTAESETKKRADELQKVSEFQARMLAQVDPTAAGKLLSTDVRSKLATALERDGLPDAERAAELEAFTVRWRRVNATDVARQLIDRTILKPAVEAIEKEFADQPEVDAALRQTLADRYKDLGLFDAALPLQERALSIRRRVFADDDPRTLDSINNLGEVLRTQGKWPEALRYFREALEKLRRVLGEEHRLTLVAQHNIGYVLRMQGELDLAEPYCREALEKMRRVLGEEDKDTLTSLENLAMLVQAQGKLAEAESYYRESLEKRRRVFGEEDPYTLKSINNMGFMLVGQGKFAEALPYLRDALEKDRRVLGEEHPDTLVVLNNLGFALQNQGKLSEAEPFIREALDKQRRVLGDEHTDTMTSINNFGIFLQDEGKLDEAEKYVREAMALRRRVLGDDHPDTLGTIGNVGRLLQAANRLDEAEPYLREALEKKRRVRGEEHPDTITSINNMGVLLQSQGKLDEAEKYFRESTEKCTRVLGPEHPNTLITTINLGSLLEAKGDHAESARLLAPLESRARTAFTGAYARWLVKLLVNLGRARAGLKEFAAAESPVLEAQDMCAKLRGESHKDTRDCDQALVDLYAAWNAAEPNKGYDAQCTEWKAKLAANRPPVPAPVTNPPAPNSSAPKPPAKK